MRVYTTYVRMAIKSMLLFRVNTVGMLVSTVLWSGLTLSTVYFTTRSIRTVFGYSGEQLMILAAIQVIFLGFFHGIISKNMERIPELMNRGTFDFLLLKPIDAQFSASLTYVYPAYTVRILLGVGVLAYYLHLYGFATSWFSIALFGIFLIFGFVTIYSVWLLVTTLVVWFPQMDNIVDFLYYLNVSSRFPYEFLREIGIVALLCLFPFAISLTIPMKVLLGSATVTEVVILVLVALALFTISRKFWVFALKHYTSASS